MLVLPFLAASCIFPFAYGRDAFMRKGQLHDKQLQAEKLWKSSQSVRLSSAPTGRKTMTFKNPKAAHFYVDGTSIPEVDFDIGPSWSGLLPISGKKRETRKLFFWFFPPGPRGSMDDLIFWDVPVWNRYCKKTAFQWSWGQAKPTVNEWSWTNISSMLYVEQPVGTGFSQGIPNIKNERELAAQLVGFFQQFLKVFAELAGKNLYLAGESYAGTYIPYIANYIYQHPNELALNLQGIWMADPVLTHYVVQQQIPVVDFVHKYENVFALNKTFMASLDAKAVACNYANYSQTYLKYPPTGLLPLPGTSVEFDDGCDLWSEVFEAALLINPAFNIYRIFDTYPVLWDVLGFPGSFPQVQVDPVYFDREDVKCAIHAPVNVTWSECSEVDVFPDGDASAPSALTVLPGVIEKSRRTVIVHGTADFILIADGARIALQNMTWGGKQGFQAPLEADSFIVDGIGAMGTAKTERGLSYIEVALAGHMVPQFSPVAAFQTMEYLLGFRSNP